MVMLITGLSDCEAHHLSRTFGEVHHLSLTYGEVYHLPSTYVVAQYQYCGRVGTRGAFQWSAQLRVSVDESTNRCNPFLSPPGFYRGTAPCTVTPVILHGDVILHGGVISELCSRLHFGWSAADPFFEISQLLRV